MKHCPINVHVFLVDAARRVDAVFEPTAEWWIVDDRKALEAEIAEVCAASILEPVPTAGPGRDRFLRSVRAQLLNVLERWWLVERLRVRPPTLDEGLILGLLPRCSETITDEPFQCPRVGTREGYDGTSWCEQHAEGHAYPEHDWAPAYREWALALARRVDSDSEITCDAMCVTQIAVDGELRDGESLPCTLPRRHRGHHEAMMPNGQRWAFDESMTPAAVAARRARGR